MSLLTGRRPDTTRVTDLTAYFRSIGGNFTTIPQFFKEHGYTSINVGKMFHKQAEGGDDDISWSEVHHGRGAYRGTGASWEAVDDSLSLIDTVEADMVMEKLGQLAPAALSGEENFFMGWGLHRPHLPFMFPKSFGDYYPAEIDTELPR